MFNITCPFVKGTTLFKAIALILIVSVITSCAGSYKPIVPERLSYGSTSTSDGIEYSYQHGILAHTKNKKYANREMKRAVKLMAVELTNKTDHTINFRRDVKIFMGDKLVLPVEPAVVHQQLRQPAGLYMLWSLLWVVVTKCEGEGDCSSTPLPVGLIIGIGNTSVASSSNKKFLTELNVNSILDREIAPGETVQGLLGISSETTGSISLKLN
jgi:hypothetical protein